MAQNFYRVPVNWRNLFHRQFLLKININILRRVVSKLFVFFINSELDELESLLNSALDMLAPEGRLSIISFHSLEDRMVKHFMKKTK